MHAELSSYCAVTFLRRAGTNSCWYYYSTTSLLFTTFNVRYLDAAKKTFDAVDINRDGRVTRDEMKKRNHMFWYTDNTADVCGLYGITLTNHDNRTSV